MSYLKNRLQGLPCPRILRRHWCPSGHFLLLFLKAKAQTLYLGGYFDSSELRLLCVPGRGTLTQNPTLVKSSWSTKDGVSWKDERGGFLDEHYQHRILTHQ